MKKAITKIQIKNFKGISDETIEFNNFELLVGANNSGKSTILQAMAIWQYCIEQFRSSRKSKGSTGVQVVLPNFTALPLPEFVLLWKDRTERKVKGKGSEFILIEIRLFWNGQNGEESSFGVQLRYASPQTVYAQPQDGWSRFNELDKGNQLPHIVYVPPFSGIEPHEEWRDDGNIRQQVGKSQPGSVIRNLLYRVIDKDGSTDNTIQPSSNKAWEEIHDQINRWFGVELLPPQYTKKVSTEIKVEYKEQGKKKPFDIISGGSGFHQILILLAFYYGYDDVTTILFDEPDAHLHANLQKNILSYFLSKKEKQFIIASHSSEFIHGIDIHNITSILSRVPKRIESSENIIQALSCVDNEDIVRTRNSPFILYIEGEDDSRILSAWAERLQMSKILDKFYIYILRGTSKEDMTKRCDTHFKALKEINPIIKRVLLLDYDSEDSYHPQQTNSCLKEWDRKNIDNYLLVQDAWQRALTTKKADTEAMFLDPYYKSIIEFFTEQNLTLPKGYTWRNVKANIFKVVDGKKILFEDKDSLFHRLKAIDGQTIINRQDIASSMTENEIHQDVIDFFEFLQKTVKDA